MIDLIANFFKKTSSTASGHKNNEEPHDILVATCALFLEMANIDGEFSKSERENIVSILKKNYDLSTEHAEALIETADDELAESIDLWQFAKCINHNYSVEEKIKIIEVLWEVVYTDGRLDKHEDYLVHKLAKLLRVTHKQLIDAKLRVIRSS